MTALGGFLLGKFLNRKDTTVISNNTKVIRERPMTPTEIAEHEERLKRIKEHEPKVKVTLVPSRELTEEDFIGMPLTKSNLAYYQAWKGGAILKGE